MVIDHGQTDIARRRPLNEDSIFASDDTRAVFRQVASSDDDAGVGATVAAMRISQRACQELVAAANAQGVARTSAPSSPDTAPEDVGRSLARTR